MSNDRTRLFIISVLIAYFAKLITSHSQTVPNVVLLYETLCPGCRMTMSQELPKALTKFGSDIFVSLVPYGFADMKIGPNGSVNFYCHHGPDECIGNAWHACSHFYMSPKERLEYVICTMTGYRMQLPRALKKCTSPGMAAQLEKCAKGPQGIALVKLMADISQMAGAIVSPNDSVVPWVPYFFIDGRPDNDSHNTKSLTELICEKATNKPQQCLDTKTRR
ncbi:gamma-interferon-inducible lysosomal thiol reductase-like isoform X2 [Varroa jacobsoni]|uniref:gamma-interferon-inducible lysosomal thiol reductase-like isoform X2 n=1 Tax=Varroa jacobsoni TaxID=62625 RepID=UPI000BF25342|nr:gamma-interferon-inducible lysosomal thiol reductase-like isoform X2 [Varroa jacobsoni]